MKICSHGALIDHILKKGPFKDENLLKHLLLQICKALDAVHTTASHSHLDIKTENILIGDDYLLKLSDFGFAHPILDDITKKYGTEGYQAPEILSNKPYKGVQADIFSLAVVFFIMKFGNIPFGEALPKDDYYKLYLKNPSLFWRCHPTIRKFKETID